FQAWMRRQFADNVPYNKMVRELLTASVAGDGQQAFQRMQRGERIEPSPLAFYVANEAKPENLAAATSRLFMGVKIECAQCHNHPFAKWTRKQFWEYTAFFAGIKTTNPNAGVFAQATEDTKVKEIVIPGPDKKVQARFLDGTVPAWNDDTP